ncbi:hypothetical protein GCM10007276_31880 [Agaricicola taiwanensis]|uniref:Uncharacterized protein n=1 Tax=Agaricicola taiwanensis TaxID=591372 RepID=A0A8J2YML2_9RHOB|nr:hypothetical protein [Agaricicola taiwanensis]GGE52479.1 hypothetical protein GCM10007276_31880 [Agaricicola taiwanensis]
MRKVNLFCRADLPELVCAVPEDQPLPAFITTPAWGFVGRIAESKVHALSAHRPTTEPSTKLNGFYLFQLINLSDLRRHIELAGHRYARHG